MKSVIYIKPTCLELPRALSYWFSRWTHGSRLIISRAKQDASPNELTNPEIFKKYHHQNIHSFALILPAIFPDTDISSCVCIVLLFETSSSSHVQHHIARQRGRLGPETATVPCLTASNHEICHFYLKPARLESPRGLTCGFSRWSRCNPRMQTDNISCQARREPKRIDQSWDIQEIPSPKYT